MKLANPMQAPTANKLNVKLSMIALMPFTVTAICSLPLLVLSETRAEQQHLPWQVFLENNLVLLISCILFGSLVLSFILIRRTVARLTALTHKATTPAMLEPPASPKPDGDELEHLDHLLQELGFRLLDAVKREQAAIAYAADVILSIAIDGTVKSTNSAITARHGWKANEVVSKPVWQLLAEDHWHKLQQALKDTQSGKFEAPFLDSKGKRTICLWSTSWSSSDQTLTIVVHDISPRKRIEETLAASEAHSRLLMEEIPVGLVLLSEDARIHFANRMAAQIIGQPQTILIGTNFTSYLSGDAFDSASALVGLVDQPFQNYFVTIKKNADESAQVQLEISRFGHLDEQNLLLATMSDCSDRNRLDELKQRLVAIIAHDIASPLTTVQSTLSLATSGMFGTVGPSLRTDLDKAERECSNILQIFKNMVRFEKLAAGFVQASPSQLALKELTKQALEVATPQINDKNLTITYTAMEDIAALGDSDKIALVGSKLLQLVAETCDDNITITVGGFREAAFACWLLRISGNPKALESLNLYLNTPNEFDVESLQESGDLDLILWRLLLYQCRAKISCHTMAQELGCTIVLRLPLRELPSIAASVT